MCRFAFYLGAGIALDSLVTDPSNSIIHQSFESKEREEPLNGDGFGVAWYVPTISERPGLFRSVTPAWNDQNLVSLARVTHSPCVLAHVRAATTGSAVNEQNCHPFVWGPLAFMHNGHVGGFRAFRRQLLERLSGESFDWIAGSTDSEHLFALCVDHYRASTRTVPAERLADALTRTIREVEALRRAAGVEDPSLLNLVATDGNAAAISRFTGSAARKAHTLYLSRGGRYVCEDGVCRMQPATDGGQAVVVASEPLSADAGWEAVPTNHMVVIRENLDVDIRPIVL